MAKTLGVAKVTLEQDLKDAFKTAGYDAYMEQFLKSNTTSKSDSDAQKGFEDLAEKFSKTLSESISKDMAQAIYDFVMEIGIQVSSVPPSVIAPSGPCSGTIPMTSFTVT